MYFLQALVTDEIISPMCMNKIHIRQIITYNVIFTGGKSFLMWSLNHCYNIYHQTRLFTVLGLSERSAPRVHSTIQSERTIVFTGSDRTSYTGTLPAIICRYPQPFEV